MADSRQVYRRLDIATNKPPPEWRQRIRYHLLDLVDPGSTFNVFQWLGAAREAIDDIGRRDRLPVVEGGTMLYVDALCFGFTLAEVPPRPQRRRELDSLPTAELVALLQKLDPAAALDPQNRVRMVRAIEVLEVAGPPLSRLQRRQPPPWQPLRIGLRAPAEIIARRLEERSQEQVRRGLVEETRRALATGVPESAPVLTGIGYAEAVQHLRGELSLQQLPAKMAESNRRYARRQLSWWRRDPGIVWLDAEPDPLPAILDRLRRELS